MNWNLVVVAWTVLLGLVTSRPCAAQDASASADLSSVASSRDEPSPDPSLPFWVVPVGTVVGAAGGAGLGAVSGLFVHELTKPSSCQGVDCVAGLNEDIETGLIVGTIAAASISLITLSLIYVITGNELNDRTVGTAPGGLILRF